MYRFLPAFVVLFLITGFCRLHAQNSEIHFLTEQELHDKLVRENALKLSPVTPEVIITEHQHLEGEEGHEHTISSGITPPVLESNCSNSDFNEGTWRNWQGCYGLFANPCQYAGYLEDPPHPLHKIINSSWDDANTSCGLPTTPALTSLFPGQPHVARIGDTTYTSNPSNSIMKAASLKYSVHVSNSSYLFVYRYAVVLQSGGHALNQQPDFKVTITDTEGNQLGGTCGYYYVAAPTSGPPPAGSGWHTCPNGNGTVYWKEWTTVGMDLTPYLNQDVTLKFEVRGCTYNTHFGYAYLTAYCGYLELQTALCEGDTSATLTAPPGFGYLWSTSNGYMGINGDTTQSIVVPNPTTGSTYKCILTAVNGCQVAILTTLTYTVIHAGFTEFVNCASRPTQFNDTTTVNQNSVVGWRWFFGDPSSGPNDSSDIKNPTHIFSAPGTYNVTLISYSTEGCADTVSKTITVGLLPTITSTPTVVTRCSNDPVNYHLYANLPGTWYNWRAIPRSPNITGYTSNNVPNNPDSVINDVLVNTGSTVDTVVYRVIPKTPGCAGDSTDIKVAVKPLPRVTFVPASPSICGGQTTNITLNSPVPGSSYIWTASTSSPSVTGFGPGSGNVIAQTLNSSGQILEFVTYTVTPSAMSCTGAPTDVLVRVNPKPHVITAPMSQTICSGGTTSITLLSSCLGTAFTWTPVLVTGNVSGFAPGSGPNIMQTLINNINTQGYVKYNVSLSSGSCIGNDTTYDVYVNPTPHVFTNRPDTTICSETSTSIRLTGDVAGTTYTWVPSLISGNVTGFSAGSGDMIAQTLTNTGFTDGLVRYAMVPHAAGCNGITRFYDVTVHPKPDVTFSPVNPVICSGDQTFITLNSQVAGTVFTWTATASSPSVSGYSNGTGASIRHFLTTPGIGPETVTYSVTGTANGCSGNVYQVVVTINPTPSLTTSPLSQTICSNSATNIILTSLCPTATYSWTTSLLGGNITGNTAGTGSSIIQTLINTLTTQGSVNYAITPAAGSCNGTTRDFRVYVNPLPVPVITGSNAVCKNATGVTYSTAAGKSAYVWTVSAGGTITAGGTATSNTVTVTWNTAGPQTVSVGYTDENNCTSASATVFNVTVNPLPVPVIIGPASICANTPTSYTTTAGMSGYFWTITGGTILSGQGTNTINVNWPALGTGTLTVTYQDLNGCTPTTPTSYPVNINGLPVPSLVGPGSVCVGTTQVYSTDIGMTNYIWSVSAGGTITAGGGASDNTVTVNWPTTGARTVSVNYSVATGCTAPSPTTFNVTVNPRPAPTIGGAQDVCTNTTGVVYTTQAGKTNYTWAVSAGGTITAGGGLSDNTVTVTWNTPGAQTVSVNYNDANNCNANSPTVYNVTIHALPVPTIAGNTTFCAGTTGVLYTTQPGQNNYQWTISGGGTITAGGTSTSNTATVTWNTAGAQSISVNYVDSWGCTAPAVFTLPVTVNPLPVPSINGSTTFCEGASGIIYSTQAGQSNYIWNISAGGTITAGGGATDNTVTVTWVTPGAKTVSVNYTNSFGCTAASAVTLPVTVNPRPVPTLGGNQSVCKDATGIVYTTDAGKSGYVWSVSAGGSITAGGGPTDNTVTVTWSIAGPQTVSVNYNNSFNCNAYTATVLNVTVHPIPVPTLSGNQDMCAGTTGVVYTTQPGQNNYQWLISSGGTVTAGGTSTSNTVTITWTTAGAQGVTVNYVDGFGCTPPEGYFLPVIINPLPTPTVTGTTPVCEGVGGLVYTTQPGFLNYVWTVSPGGTITAGGTSTSNTATVTWNNAGARSVSVNYTDAETCTAAAPFVFPVTVNARPVPALSGNLSVCENSTGNVYTTDAGKSNYVWSISAGGTITSGGGPTDNTVTVKWITPGAATVSVDYQNAAGCNAYNPTVINVTVHALPAPTITGNQVMCAGTNNVVYTTQSGQNNYLWTVSAGGTITAGGTSTSNTVTVNWVTPGAKTVTVNYVDAFGCTAASSFVLPVTINPLPTPTIAGTSPVCEGLTGLIYTTQTGFLNYVWNISPGGTITAGGTSGSNTATVTWNSAGARSISVNYTDGNGCTAASSFTLPVTVNARPVPALSGNLSVCENSTGNIYTTDAGKSNYVWNISAGGTITAGGGPTDNTVTVKWITPAAATVSVDYQNAAGCNAYNPTVINITVHANPTPTITGNQEMCAGTNNVVYTTQSGQNNYLWTVSAGGTITAGGTSTSNTVTVNWVTPGAKTVTVNYVDAFGCTAPASFTLPVTINPLPTPTVAGTSPVCEGTTGLVYTTEAGFLNYIWNVSPGGVITAGGTSTSNTATVTWNNAGARSISVNYTDNKGCTAASAFNLPVTVNVLPTPVVAGTQILCAGTTGVVYSTLAGQTNYSWVVSPGGTITAGGTAASNTVTVTWNNPGAQFVKVNYFNSFGCTAVSSFNLPVTVNPLPVPPITGPANVCRNSTTSYFTTSAMSNYTWTLSSGGSITSGLGTNTININWTTNGIHTITVNYNDPNGCTAASATTYNVTVNDLPIPLLNGLAGICTGFSTTYNTDPGMSNYLWTVSPGGTVTAGGTTNDNTITVLWTGVGAQNITVNYTMGTGCTAGAPTSKNVTVHPLPVPAVTGITDICEGPNPVVYNSDAGMTNYQWTVTGGTISGGGGPSDNFVAVKWLTFGTKTVSVNYTNGNGCTALTPTPLTVIVHPLPVPSTNGPQSICLNATGTYGTDAGMSNYQWTVSPGGTILSGSGTNAINVLWSVVGPQTITVNYVNSNSCTAATPSSYAVTVNPLPSPTISGNNSLCSGLSAVYKTQKLMINYLWNVSGGGTIIAGGSVNDSTVTVLWTTSGTNTVSVNYTIPVTNCTAAAATPYTVIVKPRPVVNNPITTSSICSGTSNNYVLQADLPGTTFAWTTSGSSAQVSGFSNGSGPVISQTLVNSGSNIENVTYTVTPTLNGCDGTTTTPFVTTVFPVAKATFTPAAQSFCSGGTTGISISSSVAGTTFTWTATPGSANVTGFSNGSGPLIQQTLLNSGTMIEGVTYNVSPLANGCPGQDKTITVDVYPFPAVSYVACNEILTTTSSKSFTLRGGVPLGGTYNGTGVAGGIFNPAVAGPGSHLITYGYSNTWGCAGSGSQSITVLDPAPFTCGSALTDIRDNQMYSTVQIGTQCWMSVNFNYGNVISGSMQRDNCIPEKYCYGNNPVNCTTSGGLYQWDEMMHYDQAVTDQGICPPGWHIPSENDWNTLFNTYSGKGFSGDPLKTTGFSGFNAIFFGLKFDNVDFKYDGFATFFWSSTSRGSYKAWAHALNQYDPSIGTHPGNRANAHHVRCIKD